MTSSPDLANEDIASLDQAFAEIKTMLERDGFTADWKLDDQGGIRFRVIATETACRDCLVPKIVIEAILSDVLEGTGHQVVDVELPNDASL